MGGLETRLRQALLTLGTAVEQHMERTPHSFAECQTIDAALSAARAELRDVDAPCPPGVAAAHVPLSVSSSAPAGVSRVAPSDAVASGLPSGTPDLETVLLPKLVELEAALILAQNELQDAVRAYRGKEPIQQNSAECAQCGVTRTQCELGKVHPDFGLPCCHRCNHKNTL
jgi:hypothetical protein